MWPSELSDLLQSTLYVMMKFLVTMNFLLDCVVQVLKANIRCKRQVDAGVDKRISSRGSGKMFVQETGDAMCLMQPTTHDAGEMVCNPADHHSNADRLGRHDNVSWAKEQIGSMDLKLLNHQLLLYSDVVEKLAKKNVKNMEDITDLDQNALRQLIPALLRYILNADEAKKKVVYHHPPADWPAEIPFADPCNKGPDDKKPSKEDNVLMAQELYKRYQEKRRTEETQAESLKEEYGEDPCQALTQYAQVAMEEPVLKCSITKIDDIDNLKVDDLRKLMRFLAKCRPIVDDKSRNIYVKDSDWPEDLYWGDPNNGKKPSKDQLVLTVKELYKRFEVQTEERVIPKEDEDLPEEVINVEMVLNIDTEGTQTCFTDITMEDEPEKIIDEEMGTNLGTEAAQSGPEPVEATIVDMEDQVSYAGTEGTTIVDGLKRKRDVDMVLGMEVTDEDDIIIRGTPVKKFKPPDIVMKTSASSPL